MERLSRRQTTLVAVAVFGIIPCVLGVGVGLYLRLSGTIWLTNTGGFWPFVCLCLSLVALAKRAIAPFEDRTVCVCAWLVVTWTWLYFPLWLMATEISKSSGIVSRNGQVTVVSEGMRQPADKVWFLTDRSGNRIVKNVVGAVTINSVDLKYRYDEPYVATRDNDEDLSKPIIRAATAILTVEASKSRSSRIAVFDKPEAHARLIDEICDAVVAGKIACPLKLSLTPQNDATIPGAVWSKYYTEKEAIDEGHLPTLVQLLTQDNSQLVDLDQVLARFMELAVSVDELAKVGRKPHMLSAYQFDELIERILATPDGGEDAASILIEVGRLKLDQHQALRTKVFREASIEKIIKYAAPLRISDAELVQLTARMHTAIEASPDVAVLALEAFGARLPTEVQHRAVQSIVGGKAPHALTALRHMNCSGSLREQILNKILSDASFDDFYAVHLSRERLGNMLTPAEMRLLIESVIEKSESSAKWLDFAIRVLPLRLMTPAERKLLLSGRLFESAKAALEFVSENRQYLEAADVNDVTLQYARTIMPDMCLHLSHRNTNRRAAYFSEVQLKIFRDCAQSK